MRGTECMRFFERTGSSYGDANGGRAFCFVCVCVFFLKKKKAVSSFHEA